MNTAGSARVHSAASVVSQLLPSRLFGSGPLRAMEFSWSPLRNLTVAMRELSEITVGELRGLK